jgi:putative peptide zinc metalloprotease protein
MANPFHSASWFQVARLRPRLKAHVRVRRHRYRGNIWYVIDDGAAGKVHRFPKGAYEFAGRLDGETTVEALWLRLIDRLGEDAPTQDDVIMALGQLHSADLIASDAIPDPGEAYVRQKKERRQVWLQNLKSPMSLRINLIDPDRFLTRTLPYLAPLLGVGGLLLWLSVVIPALLLAARHWDELTGNLADRVLAADNLLLIALIYPVVKTIHELAHGYTAKRFGREVREMGVMLLLLIPVPYVDASHASALPSKWQRALVGAAGMIGEVFVAALATYAWVTLEPGLARAIAFNVMFVAGVSTLLVNGNPFLRFDGYYILADLIEIPNLGTRANRFWAHLIDKHIFRTHGARPFDATAGERPWLVLYAPAAFIARMLMLFGIAVFVAKQYFFIGVLIALWSLWTGVGLPVWKMFAHVFSSPQLHANRQRAIRITLGSFVAVAVLLFVIPAPRHVYAQGIVWLPEAAHVRAATDGVIARVVAGEGAFVTRGTPLAEAANPVLQAEVDQLAWRMREVQAQADAELVGDRVKRQISQDDWRETAQRLAIQQQRLGDLALTAGTDGKFVLAAAPASDLPGRYLQKGTLVGYVTPDFADVARIAVPQDDIALARGTISSVRFRLASMPGRSWEGKVLRAIPGGTHELPSEALSAAHGGTIPTDPNDAKALTALSRVFLFDIALPAELRRAPFGTRVHVRLQLGWEPLGWQMARRVRQLFLSQFDA